jgi:hypothetical protein
MQMFFGVLTGLIVPWAVRFYLVYLAEHGDRHHGFEAWCEGRPLLFAFLCRDRAEEVAARVTASLGKRGEATYAGGVFPWPFYRVKLVAERLGDDVVGVYVAGAALRRGKQERPDVRRVIDELVLSGAVTAEEIWLHGHLHTEDASEAPPEDVTWRGRLVEQRHALELRAFRELPFWLRPWADRPPPSNRERDELAAEPVDATLPAVA